MTDEFKHGSVGTSLSQAEWEGIGAHVLESQATGDIVYASSASQLRRLGISVTSTHVLSISGGIPAWAAPAAAAAGSLTGTILASGVVTSSLATVGVLNSGSITSGFGAIDNGTSTLGTGIITTVGDLSLDGDLDFTGAQAITTTTGDLSLSPANGDINIPTDIGLVFGNDGEKIEGDGTDLTILSSGDLDLETIGDITLDLNEGTQKYSLTQPAYDAASLVIESQTSGGTFNMSLHTKDGDGGDSVLFNIWGKGTVSAVTNRERLIMGWSTPLYFLNIDASGTGGGAGVARNFEIQNDGTAWMTFDAGGNVQILNRSLDLGSQGGIINIGASGNDWDGTTLALTGSLRIRNTADESKSSVNISAVNTQDISSATSIYEVPDFGALVFVGGREHSPGHAQKFEDLVWCSQATNPSVISSYTAGGSPAARTYTRSVNDLMLAMASDTYDVSVLVIQFNSPL